MTKQRARKLAKHSLLKASAFTLLCGMNIVASASAQAAPELYFYPSGPWQVAKQDTGNLDGKICTISSEYNNGFIVQFAQSNFGKALMHVDFRQDAFSQGQEIGTEISVPGKSKMDANASAKQANILSVDLGQNAAIIDQLSSSSVFDVSLGGNAFRFHLTGFGQAYNNFQACLDGRIPEPMAIAQTEPQPEITRMAPAAQPVMEPTALASMAEQMPMQAQAEPLSIAPPPPPVMPEPPMEPAIQPPMAMASDAVIETTEQAAEQIMGAINDPEPTREMPVELVVQEPTADDAFVGVTPRTTRYTERLAMEIDRQAQGSVASNNMVPTVRSETISPVQGEPADPNAPLDITRPAAIVNAPTETGPAISIAQENVMQPPAQELIEVDFNKPAPQPEMVDFNQPAPQLDTQTPKMDNDVVLSADSSFTEKIEALRRAKGDATTSPSTRLSTPEIKVEKQTASMEVDFTHLAPPEEGNVPPQDKDDPIEMQYIPTGSKDLPQPESIASLRDIDKEDISIDFNEPAPAPKMASSLTSHKIIELEGKLEALSAQNMALERKLESAEELATSREVSVATDNWDLERATMRYNEAERQIDRLSRKLSKERAKWEMERQELETMLFDPRVTEKQQLAKLATLEDELSEKQEELERQRKRFEERIKLLEERLN